VIIGLNFGRQSDWYQNITAAGTCGIRLGGEQLTLGAPALVPAGQATRVIPWLFSFTLRHVVQTAECVQLPILQSSLPGHPPLALLPARGPGAGPRTQIGRECTRQLGWQRSRGVRWAGMLVADAGTFGSTGLGGARTACS